MSKLLRVALSGGPPCPLEFTSDEEAAHELVEGKWLEGPVLMKNVLSHLRDVDNGWHGWVEYENHDSLKGKLELLRQ